MYANFVTRFPLRRHVLRVYTSVSALHQHLFHISHNEVLYFIGLRGRRMCDWKNFIIAHALTDHLYINPEKITNNLLVVKSFLFGGAD